MIASGSWRGFRTAGVAADYSAARSELTNLPTYPGLDDFEVGWEFGCVQAPGLVLFVGGIHIDAGIRPLVAKRSRGAAEGFADDLVEPLQIGIPKAGCDLLDRLLSVDQKDASLLHAKGSDVFRGWLAEVFSE